MREKDAPIAKMKNCGNCDHFLAAPNAPPNGNCVAHNPQAIVSAYVHQEIPVPQPNGGMVMLPALVAQQINGYFPITTAHRYCGEWTPIDLDRLRPETPTQGAKQ